MRPNENILFSEVRPGPPDACAAERCEAPFFVSRISKISKKSLLFKPFRAPSSGLYTVISVAELAFCNLFSRAGM